MEDPFFHVPQQSRRHKLRYTHPDNHLNNHHDHHHPFLSPIHHHEIALMAPSPPTSALNLSLSSPHARGGGGVGGGGVGGGVYNATPVGPFTGYASILGRSRFLRPAQELLEEFSFGSGVDNRHGDSNTAKNLLQDSRIWFVDDGADQDVSSLPCTNPNLVSMLHEVYKRYKLYCQQMQSAVTSFESVAGLANAAPFICFAISAMFRHFHCLKNAILDQIRIASKRFSGADFRNERTSGSCSGDKGASEQNKQQVYGPNFLHHPVWRSQRGFPDKAVTVLRTWLFEHFLHPYPSDSDKQMLAQKTGLSRSQVSNWFTNARVRLWKPMVEEMHTLEKKTQSSKGADASKFIDLSPDHNHTSPRPQLTEQDFEIMNHHRDQENRYKRSRIDTMTRSEQMKEQFGVACNNMSSNQMINVMGSTHIGPLSHSGALSNTQENTTGICWSNNQGQIVPFWLARQ